MRDRKKLKFLNWLHDAEVISRHEDAQKNISWLKDMLILNPKGSPAFGHYQAQLSKQQAISDEAMDALIERGMIL